VNDLLLILVIILAIVCALLILRFALLRRELHLLSGRIRDTIARSSYGSRLYTEDRDPVLGEMVAETNRMIESYEKQIAAASEAEENVRLSVTGISHDIRTPLTSLTGYVQLLKKELEKNEIEARGADDAKPREYMEQIRSSANTRIELTENFYELSRLEKSGAELPAEEVDLREAVTSVFLEFYEAFESRGIEVDIEEGDPLPVMAEPSRLKRILYNLVQNLLRYAKSRAAVSFAHGEGTSSVTIENDTDAPLPEDIEKLFERFWSADPSRSKGSSGLGLYVSRRLAENMGGSLSANIAGPQTLSLRLSLLS
jgi:signal transduction histidine kinase